jgi:acyl transferase domain-containing protein
VTEFDHAEFGISAKDVYAMGLSTRKLLEHSFLALLDSGIDSRGQDVGVYAAGTAFDIQSVAEPVLLLNELTSHRLLFIFIKDIFEARGLLSGIPSMIANKVSYHLDLKGPSIPIDTACSSSLTALHLAAQALRAGECKAAVVGGSQLNHRQVLHHSGHTVLIFLPDLLTLCSIHGALYWLLMANASHLTPQLMGPSQRASSVGVSQISLQVFSR